MQLATVISNESLKSMNTRIPDLFKNNNKPI